MLLFAAAVSAIATVPATASTTPANTDALRPAVKAAYCGKNVWALSFTPANGFNPLTASAAELNANGYPERPPSTDARESALWREFAITHSIMTSSCSSLHAPLKTSAAPAARQSPQRSTRPAGTLATAVSNNWSGFQATGAAYSDIEAEWYVPKVTAPAGAAADHSAYSSTWVGIGGPGNPGFPQYPLVQAGSESDWGSGGPSYYLWYQVPPEQGTQVPVFYGPSSSALGGTLAGVHITWGTHPSGCTSSVCASIHMWDTNSFQDFNSTYVVGGNWYNDDLAEWIYERTSIGGKYPYLADAPPNFSDAEVATGGNWYDAGVIPAESALDLEEFVMETCNDSTVMAKPIKNGLSDGDIPMQFLSAGDNDVCG